ncbi:MAG: Gfo/Idh/MocA family oxidoreductase, partial [Planctomycetes bacterium]|nr:Gfo/Idh/MocA family oxidoreductase [Planctomycetota bacterium]
MAWKRFAVLGVGSRGEWWSRAIAKQFTGTIDIVALCDHNAGRNQRLAGLIAEHGQRPALFSDFARMLAEAKPDAVLIAVPDHEHARYATAAMRAGIDVVLEKPIACTAEDCRAILAARRETGRRCVVGFNLRWAPYFTQLKDIVLSGVIGDPVAVDMQWLLDTSHGADYFRRWHRQLGKSGGLLVHKSTHHFDLVNWLLDSDPVSVFARGARRFYTPQNADALGLQDRGPRCLDCRAAARCPYRLDLTKDAHLKGLYLEHEAHDGYLRDRCVFSPEIDIPDSMSVSARYASGALLTYSLQAFSPWEGLTLGVDGTKGRLEFKHVEGGETRTRVMPLGQPGYDVEVWKGDGPHGGGDVRMLEALFGEPPHDRLGRAADERAGAWSAMIGITANAS